METVKRSGRQGLDGKEQIRGTQGLQCSVDILFDAIMMDTCHYTFVQSHKKNPNATYGLGVIVICQHRFTGCNKCATVVGNVDNGGGYECVGDRRYTENFCTLPSNLL